MLYILATLALAAFVFIPFCLWRLDRKRKDYTLKWGGSQ